MTLQLAKTRRLQALTEKKTDRILVKPAHHTQVRLPKEGTVAGYLIDSLGNGCSVEQLEAETGWSKSQVLVNLYKVAKRSGIGIRRGADVLHLVMPDGSRDVHPRTRTVSTGSDENGTYTVIDMVVEKRAS